ncbi:MBL fold metallo-hydrolase [Chenggangzhangella methanolivorans]|uniref:MBL fold metallo-hydrolase n=1 Tax=Chenggangzhangella methanolivorans TaxID=1437009 RepID=A0A9E6RFN6_9HYPH|nr:MBL fold metallo-hydrolase [Chenggangzhangella methanolivorans]QZO00097.1 MBL fold metallo-hydrolase [Chenggangzhangella methanolivorans]
MSLRVTILGCGSSGGVPRVAVGWGACDPAEPRNRRRRCALLVERTSPEGVTSVLVDVGPDLRDQLIGADVRHLDGVLVTHDHADHTHGVDDLRPLVLKMRRRMDVWSDARTFEVLKTRFGYAYECPPGSDYPPILTDRRIEHGRAVSIDGEGGAIEALPIDLMHGRAYRALGFRFGALAYTPDVNGIPPESEEALSGLDLWIIDALRETPHPSHFSLSDALAAIERFRPRRAILTNLHTDLDYRTLKDRLPPGIDVAFDGMVIETG